MLSKRIFVKSKYPKNVLFGFEDNNTGEEQRFFSTQNHPHDPNDAQHFSSESSNELDRFDKLIVGQGTWVKTHEVYVYQLSFFRNDFFFFFFTLIL